MHLINKKTDALIAAVTSVQDKLNGHEDRIEQLELNEEIKTTQVFNIRTAAKTRVFNILGEDVLDYQKYFRYFISRLYSDAKKYAGLGSTISTTRKCDYQKVIDYIEAWIPKKGCVEFKREIDEKAAAKRKAKDLGYTM